jgi:hypothetical protein
MLCAGCSADAPQLLLVKELVRGRLWPPFPVCARCYQRYRSVPTREAADEFVCCLAEEMLRRAAVRQVRRMAR